MISKERADRATELLLRLHGLTSNLLKQSGFEIVAEIDAFLNQVPDFGEPWWGYGERIKNTEGKVVVMSCFSEELQSRIVDCINACAGMRDPAAEIAALKKGKK